MIDIHLERSVPTAVEATERTLEVAAMFGLGVDETRRIQIVPPIDLTLRGGEIVFVTGPSGSGKSTILRLIRERVPEAWSFSEMLEAKDDRPLIEQVAPDSSSLESVTRTLALAGLADAFLMLRRPSELSDGQRYRFALARLIDRAERFTMNGPVVILADEFGATLDRLTASVVARNVRRWVRATPHVCLVAATTHDDLLDALDPDVLVWKGLGERIEVARRERGSESREAASGDSASGETAGRDDGYVIERGTLRDYHELSEHHYKSRAPGGATAVFVIRRDEPTVVGRYLSRRSERFLAGVLVRGLPHLSCSLRDHATNGRYRGLSQRDAATLLNAEMRTISRVVIDPRCRGLGLAHRLVRHALDHPETIYTEAMAAMGRVNPFFEKAGMMRYDGPPRREHARLLDAIGEIGLRPCDLASSKRVKAHLNSLPRPRRAWFEAELRRWHAAVFFMSRRRRAAATIDEALTAARDRLLARCVYYLHRVPPTGVGGL